MNIARIIGGNPLWQWLLALAVTLVGILFLVVLLRTIAVRLQKRARKTETRIDDLLSDMLAGTRRWFSVVLALYIGSRVLSLPPEIDNALGKIALLVFIIQAGLWAVQILSFILAQTIERRAVTDPAILSTKGLLRFFGKALIWSVIVLLCLDNLGIDITGLVAGLGIGGIAIALALQSVLGDIFASLSIVLDNPFQVGDFIIVGDYMGTVEQIGIKTTRVRSLSGEQLVFSNTDLLSSRIRNYKRMQERRVVFSFGVVYQTSFDLLKTVPDVVRSIFEGTEQTRLDRVHFKDLGDSALNFEVVYYVLVPDYNRYMDIQQQVNLDLFQRFAELGIEFAYPTQTLYLVNEAGQNQRASAVS